VVTHNVLSPLLASYSEPQAADADTLAWMSKTTLDARKALVSYGMPAEVLGHPILTPNSLLLRFKGTDELTIASLEKKRSQFYTTHGLKIVNVREEPGAVAMSVERSPRQVVQLGSVWKHWNPSPSTHGNTKLLVAVKEADNSPLYLDPLTQSPHTLIAGTSGSGKSVLLQNILLAIAATNSPSLTQVILIDPKHGVDYGPLGHLPHIQGGIITNVEDALHAIQDLVQEMEARYPLLNQAGVNHVKLYNQQRPDKLPYIWLIHDEFADWMQDEHYRDEVVALVNRLGMKARAAGIFLIFAAQRPSVEVMPMQLRDNLDNRLILRVAQEGTSQFCLGEKGAENLLPQGQMLARLGGAPSVLCQVPFADLTELQTFVNVLTAIQVTPVQVPVVA
jgi:S-DNA-T family DNA segregation ATPase FtsK/SpoIIIE